MGGEEGEAVREERQTAEPWGIYIRALAMMAMMSLGHGGVRLARGRRLVLRHLKRSVMHASCPSSPRASCRRGMPHHSPVQGRGSSTSLAQQNANRMLILPICRSSFNPVLHPPLRLLCQQQDGQEHRHIVGILTASTHEALAACISGLPASFVSDSPCRWQLPCVSCPAHRLVDASHNTSLSFLMYGLLLLHRERGLFHT